MDIVNIISALGGGVVVGALISWIRHKKRDVATENKINAEAQEIRAKADVLITDGALRIVERLSTDLDEARDEIEKLIKIVSEMKILHEKNIRDHEKEALELHNKLNEAKDLIETKRRHCIDIAGRISQLKNLLLLKQQGLSQEQLEDFINSLNELINSTPLATPTNLSS